MSIKVIVDGNNINFPDQKPRIITGTTLAPISLILKGMGYSITDWSLNNLGNLKIAPTGTMIAKKDGREITIDEAKQIFVSNKLRFSYESQSFAYVVGGRVMLPLRKVLESLGCEVHWEKVGDDDIITVITKPLGYTLKFDPNGGDLGTQNESVTVLANTSFALPVPTRKGHVFEGWYTEKEDGTRIGGTNDEFIVNANITLYARWINFENNATEYDLNTLENGMLTGDKPWESYKVFLYTGTIRINLKMIDAADYQVYVYKEHADAAIIEDIESCTTAEKNCDGNIAIGESGYYYIVIMASSTNCVINKRYQLTAFFTSIMLPANINQPYFSSLASRCAGVCAMAISCYYKEMVFSSSDQNDKLNAEVTEVVNNFLDGTYYKNNPNDKLFTGTSLNWLNVPDVTFDFSKKDSSLSPTEVYEVAVNSIRTGRPMMIHYYDTPVYDKNTSGSHWVIPLAYKADGDIDSLTVYDPYTDNHSSSVNEPWKFSRSKEYNMSGITTFYYGYATS